MFEVDLAATVDLKRERLANAGMACPDSLRFVPFDFEKDDLGTKLLAAGFDSGKVSFFNWMGSPTTVTRDAILDNLDRLAANRGSGLGGRIRLPDRGCVRAPEDRALFASMMAFVEKRGEP